MDYIPLVLILVLVFMCCLTDREPSRESMDTKLKDHLSKMSRAELERDLQKSQTVRRRAEQNGYEDRVRKLDERIGYVEELIRRAG
jgi:transcription elongation GreA/GreB family factor